jgi:hypothetical protein
MGIVLDAVSPHTTFPLSLPSFHRCNMLTERKIKADKSNPETLTHAGVTYAIRSRETFAFTTYRVGSEWVEPSGTFGARKEREFIRKGFACVHVATVHTNAVTVACDEHCKRTRVTLVSVTVTGEPDAVREYLDAVSTLPLAVATETGMKWEFLL